MFDGGGDADLYGNTVLGLAGRYYRFDLFRPLLNDFHRSVQEGLYTDVFFFVLEGAVFRRGAQERPILPDLRAAYARTLLRDTPPAEGMTDGALRRAWAQQVLGQPYDKALAPVLADIAAPQKPTEAELIRRTEEILYTHFRRARRSATDRQGAAWVGRKRDAAGGVRFVRPNGLRALSRNISGGAGGLQKPTLLSFLQGRTPEPILRRYVEDCFGVSLLTPSQLADMERALCTGVHKNCRLHVTDGTPPQRSPSPEAAWDAEQFRRQREKNRAYYQSQLSQNRLTIARLTQKLHNTLLLKQEDDGGLCRAGALCPALAWRAAALDDARVFTRRQPGDPGELTVDILLDGSASQNQQQEKLAAQDPLKFEKDKIKGAIRTDFILSAEIVAITLGIVSEARLLNQVLVLSGIALVVTVGVYGLVGVIVKIDDLGYWLAEKSSALMQALGKGLLIIAPWLMKALSIVGTLAMFLVGGGSVVHGIAPLHHAIEHIAGQQSAVVAMILPTVLNLILGFIIGGIVVLGVKAVAKMRGQAH